MDNEIIQKLTEFSTQQNEELTSKINEVRVKRENELNAINNKYYGVNEYADKILIRKAGLQSKLADALDDWYFSGGDRSIVDGLHKEIATLNSMECEIPILQKKGKAYAERARRAGRAVDGLVRKQQHFEEAKRKLIETQGKEAERLFVKDLGMYAADLPDGQKFFNEFIAKLQLKYPKQLGK